MSNVFDGYLRNAFSITAKVMGYDAIWTPLEGGAQQTARVHFNKPTEKDRLADGIDYSPSAYLVEYKEGDFVGLYEAVRNGSPEQIVVNEATYQCRSVERIYDGQNYKAHVELITA